ncbi:MAG: glycosyltransferase family 4 protein [Bacteroidales bacterium]|nr:glycosyltransferase family 4 protein [Bacteroidales bacterium]
MKSKPAIAVIGLKGLPAFGGAAAVGENIIRQLHYDYDFTVYSASSHTNLQTGNYEGICTQVVFRSMGYKKLNTLMYYLKSLFHALLSGNYDLVHLHHRDAAFIVPLLRLRYKVVLTTHGMILTEKWEKYTSLFEIQDKLFLRFVNRITAVSLKDLRFLQKVLPRRKDMVHIPNGVNGINRLSPKLQRITFAAGRIVPAKGCHLFLEAMKNTNCDHEILIIGDYSQVSDYSQHLKVLSASVKNIRFTGLIKDKNQLFELIGHSEFFVYPSLIESMSMVMLEVASLGVPIICSRIPENLDVFNEDEVLYFEPGNILDLRNKIKFAFSYPDNMQERSEKAMHKLVNFYLWQDIAQKYSSVYNSIL